MSVELDDASFEPGLSEGDCLAMWCRPSCRIKWVKNRGALLIIAWNYLVFTLYHLLRAGYKQELWNDPFRVTDAGVSLSCLAVLLPIGGWLADTRVGRYKMIRCSMWIMWIGIILATLAELLLSSIGTVQNKNIDNSIYLLTCSIMVVGLSGFLSNIIHFGIDQLIDASATEITSFITWYVLTVYASSITVHFVTDCVVTASTFYIKTLLVAVCLSLALCLDFMFHHVLVKEQVTVKSIRVIMRVIAYTIRNRHLRHNQIAVVTDNGAVPSRFNVAKHMYGGPYTSQQVDNVRRFLSVLAVVGVFAVVLGANEPTKFVKERLEVHLKVWQDIKKLPDAKVCYWNLAIRYSSAFFAVGTVLLYEFVIHPLFYRCLPRIRIMTTYWLGTAMFLLWLLSLLAFEIVVYHQHLLQETVSSNHTVSQQVGCAFEEQPDIHVHFSHMWWYIPSFLCGISTFTLHSSVLQFIWAQTPSNMKGLMLGLGFLFLGFSSFVHYGISSPFVGRRLLHFKVSRGHGPLLCEIWYFLLEAVIIFVMLIVIGVLVRKYGGRKQKNAVHVDSYASIE